MCCRQADAIDEMSLSDEMYSDVLSFLSDSGRLAFAVGASDQVWAVDLIRAVLTSAAKELKKQAHATEELGPIL